MRPGAISFRHCDLLSEGEVFENGVGAATRQVPKGGEEFLEDDQHHPESPDPPPRQSPAITTQRNIYG